MSHLKHIQQKACQASFADFLALGSWLVALGSWLLACGSWLVARGFMALKNFRKIKKLMRHCRYITDEKYCNIACSIDKAFL